jgi:hypothetical protein
MGFVKQESGFEKGGEGLPGTSDILEGGFLENEIL